MDTWQDVGQVFKSVDKDKKNQKGGKRGLIFLLVFLLREKEQEGEKENPSFSFRSSEFRRSEFVEQRVKVHLLDKGYSYIPKMRDFTKDIKEKIYGNQGFRAGEASNPCYYALRNRDSSYSSLFPP